jgi:putative flippase GtrA
MKIDLINLRDLITYFLVASAGIVVQLLVGALSQEWFPITFRQSVVLAYGMASVVGFILTKLFAFSNHNRSLVPFRNKQLCSKPNIFTLT